MPRKVSLLLLVMVTLTLGFVPPHHMTIAREEPQYPTQYLYEAADKSRVSIAYYSPVYAGYEEINTTWGIRMNFTVPPNSLTSWVIFAIEIGHVSPISQLYYLSVTLVNNNNGTTVVTEHVVRATSNILRLNLTLSGDNSTGELFYAPSGTPVTLIIKCTSGKLNVKRDSAPSGSMDLYDNNTGSAVALPGDPWIKVWLTNSTYQDFRPRILEAYRTPSSPLETEDVHFYVRASCNGSGIRGLLFVYAINSSEPIMKYMTLVNVTESNDTALFTTVIHADELDYRAIVRYAFRLYDYLGYSDIYPENALDEWTNALKPGAINFTVKDGLPPRLSGPILIPSPPREGYKMMVRLHAEDNAAVDKNSVKIYYRINYGEWKEGAMYKVSELSNDYEYSLGYPKAYDVIEMYFVAGDINGWNATLYSKDDPFRVVVSPPENPYGGMIIIVMIVVAAGCIGYYFYKHHKMHVEARKEFWKRKM